MPMRPHVGLILRLECGLAVQMHVAVVPLRTPRHNPVGPEPTAAGKAPAGIGGLEPNSFAPKLIHR